MSLSEEKRYLAGTINEYVNVVVAKGGGDEQILQNMYDHMANFKMLMDTCSGQEMGMLCQQYSGFYRFVKLMEDLAKAIADGRIKPEELE